MGWAPTTPFTSRPPERSQTPRRVSSPPAPVRLAICTTRLGPRAVYVHYYRLGPGPHRLVWAPGPKREPRTYLARLVVRNRYGLRVYGRAYAHRGRDAPVIRVQGIDAAF